MSDAEAIAATMRAINAAWLELDVESIGPALRAHFADDMVIVGATFEVLARGADACARSYAEFIATASVDAYQSGDLSIEQFGDVAIAVNPWTMTYSIFGKQSTESGREVFVFARRDGTWRAVWRAMLPA